MADDHIGSTFESFLKEEGIYEDATADAVKRVLVWQFEAATTGQSVSKTVGRPKRSLRGRIQVKLP